MLSCANFVNLVGVKMPLGHYCCCTSSGLSADEHALSSALELDLILLFFIPYKRKPLSLFPSKLPLYSPLQSMY